MAYGGGQKTDRGAHIIDIGQLVPDQDATIPIKYRATGFANPGGLYDAFMDSQFENDYQDGTRMVGSNNGPRGIQFEGADGWLLVHIHGGKLEAGPGSILGETIGEEEIHLGRTPRQRHNFVDCLQSGGKPFAAAELAQHSAAICHLNNIAMRVGRALKWDPVNEVVLDDPEANALLKPQTRAPWTI